MSAPGDRTEYNQAGGPTGKRAAMGHSVFF